MQNLSIPDPNALTVEANWSLTEDDPAVIEWQSDCPVTETWTTNEGLTQRARDLVSRGVGIVLTRQNGPPEFLYRGIEID
jgi:hypothetical protein